MSPNRAVAVLTPLVFAPVAGAVAAWLAEHAPGVNIAPGDLQEIFIAGALIAFAKSAQWLRGWQKFEEREAAAADDADREDAELIARAEGAAGAGSGAAAGVALADDEDFEDEAGFEDGADLRSSDGAVIERFDAAGLLADMDDDERFDEDPLLTGISGSPS